MSQIERAESLYSIAIRNYFQTFSVYATATSILLALTGVALKSDFPFVFVVVMCGGGVWICLQWFIAITGTRHGYRHYLHYLHVLQATHERECVPIFDPIRDKYPKWARLHQTFLGTRGSSLPFVYLLIFVLIGVTACWPVAVAEYPFHFVVASCVGFLVFNAFAQLVRKWRPTYPELVNPADQ